MGGRIARIEADRLVVIRNGAVAIAFGKVDGAAVVVALRVRGLEPDHPIKLGDGAVATAPSLRTFARLAIRLTLLGTIAMARS